MIFGGSEMQYLPVIKTLGLAIAGGFVGYKLKIPAGAMIGSMLAVAAGALLKFDLGALPSYSKPVVQVVLGAILGLGLRNTSLEQLKSLLVPAAVIITILMTAGFATAFILNRFFGLDLMTAIFSSTPGGMSELSMVAADIGANSPIVALLQLIRLMSVIVLVVPIAKLLTK